MLCRRTQGVLHLHKATGIGILRNWHIFFSTRNTFTHPPTKPKESKRKPVIALSDDLKRIARARRKAKQDVREISLQPPENGFLVKKLVPVAHDVYSLRDKLLACASRVVKEISIYTCRFCGEVHVGHPPHEIKTCSRRPYTHGWECGGLEHVMPQVECFHLYDRIGYSVKHFEQLQVDRLPAIVELCIQAGVDLPEYATKRRTCPVYNISGKTIDFEQRILRDGMPGGDIEPCGFWVKKNKKQPQEGIESIDLQSDDIRGVAIRGMETLDQLYSGVSKLMEKYAVKTCGYCPEVQVGPRNHRVRNCKGHKYGSRNGRHEWQNARIHDVIFPVWVWHTDDSLVDGLLVDRLKRYYRKVPAVVELFAQAGAPLGKDYGDRAMQSVTVPGLDEEKWVL